MILGDFQIRRIPAGVYHWDGGSFFGVVPKTLWAAKLAPDEFNRVPLAFNCYLIETGDRSVLIETGGGTRIDQRSRERMNIPGELLPLPEIISEHGVDPEKIDLVINTHLHWDHCGGNTVADGDPAFTRATYVTHRREWEHAHLRHPRDSVSYRDINYDPLVHSGRMKLIEADCEIAPGISLQAVEGHTRDMMVVYVRSGREVFCFFSDLVPTVHHLAPTWIAAFDLHPLACIDNKTALLTHAAREGWWCGFAHDCDVAFATIAEEKGRFHVHATAS